MQDTSAAITSLKKQLGADLCIMGHHYQNDAVVRHCDITGDSLELARRVPGIDAGHIIFCGVYFMGESAALLAKPGQSVHLPSLDADCLMSRMTPAPLARKVLEQLAAAGRKVVPLAYVNTDLALKAVVGEFGGAVCTSANAKTMLRWALDQGDGVLFLPDRHLGNNTAEALGIGRHERHVLRIGAGGLVQAESQPLDRKLLLWPGCCAIHARFEPEDVAEMRAQYPGCRVIAPPRMQAGGHRSLRRRGFHLVHHQGSGPRCRRSSGLDPCCRHGKQPRISSGPAPCGAVPHFAPWSRCLRQHGQSHRKKAAGHPAKCCCRSSLASAHRGETLPPRPSLPNPHA